MENEFYQEIVKTTKNAIDIIIERAIQVIIYSIRKSAEEGYTGVEEYFSNRIPRKLTRTERKIIQRHFLDEGFPKVRIHKKWFDIEWL